MEFYTQEIQGCSSKPEFLRSCEVGKQKIQYLYDAVTPHAVGRWCFTVFLILFYILRIFITQGYHLVTYVMGIFLLNRLVDFLSPKIVPESSTGICTLFKHASLDEVLPTKSSEEFRPFLRQLSELKFWYAYCFFLIELLQEFVYHMLIHIHNLYILELSRYTCGLAYTGDVLRHTVLLDNETSNISHDQVSLLTIYLRKTTPSVQWNEILKCDRLYGLELFIST
ncbi:Protein RER1 [Schistosoma japonicum]|nr:Protein RER1 [Schistosoma japonicum]